MVRDWLLQLVGVGDRKSKKRRDVLTRDDPGATSAGCMCAVFHLFGNNIHHFQFPLNPPQQHRSSSVILEEEDDVKPREGVEAPRNSLEEMEKMKKPMKASVSNSVAVGEEKSINSHVPVGIQLINTKNGKVPSSSSSPRVSTTKPRLTLDYSSSDQCNNISNNSPGLTKTPTLVARLMGLDLLPEECSSSQSLSSSSSHSKPLKRTHFQKIKRSATSFFEDDISVGARSLPETPRLSSSRRSDVEYHYHHRLSLQVNKENINVEKQQRKGGRLRILTKDQESNISSPRDYAKQVVKNVRESVSRRVGLTDITNRNTDRRDQNLDLLKLTKKNSTRFNGDFVISKIHGDEERQKSTCSPRIRLLETTKNKASVSSGTISTARLSSSSLSSVQGIHDVINPLNEVKEVREIITTVDRGSAKSTGSKFRTCEHAIKNKKEEQFVRSNATSKVKSKKTPLSSDILRIKPVKKDPSPSPTKLPQKQASSEDGLISRRSTRLPSKPSHSYNNSNKVLSSSGFPENVPARDHLHRNRRSTTGDAAADCGEYIQLILNRAGITKRAHRWYSLKHPADPFIFYHLELFHYGGGRDGHGGGDGGSKLSLRCNRKLIFQLVNELLVGILIHGRICHLGLRPEKEDKVHVFDELCDKINKFPETNCEVLEDIDSLIAIDTCKWESNIYYDEELESVMCEIEGEVVEHLVKETVVMILEEQRRRQKQRMLYISSVFM